MDRKERLGTFHLLLDDRFLEADYTLLKKKEPKNKIFGKPMNPVLCREALLELLDLIGKEEIIKHRKGFEKEKMKQLTVARKAEQLSQKERLLEQLEDGKLKEVRDAVDHLPEDHLFLDDLVKVLEKEEAIATEKAKKVAIEQKEIVLKILEKGDIAEAEASLLELPEDFMFLTDLVEAINGAKSKATEEATAKEAVEEAQAENDVIMMFIEDGKLEDAKVAIEELPDDHPFKDELVEAIAAAEEPAGTGDEKKGQDPKSKETDNSGTGGFTEKPAEDTAKKKQTQGASSKKSGNTQGSGGTG